MGTEQNNVITIDGPIASGRTTLANGLVNTYGLKHLNLETVLRRLADKARRNTIKLDDEPGIVKLAATLTDAELLNAQRNAELRKPEVERAAMQFMLSTDLATVLNAKFNALAASEPGLVAVGNSMARNVFPAAPVQLFLDAKSVERGARLARMRKLKGHDPATQDLAADWDSVSIRRAPFEGWLLTPVGAAYKESPVLQMRDLELGRLQQQVFVNTMSLGAGKVKEIAMSLISERMPHIKTISEQKKASHALKLDQLTQA